MTKAPIAVSFYTKCDHCTLLISSISSKSFKCHLRLKQTYENNTKSEFCFMC